jgi:hypothetical protein
MKYIRGYEINGVKWDEYETIDYCKAIRSSRIMGSMPVTEESDATRKKYNDRQKRYARDKRLQDKLKTLQSTLQETI